MDDSLKIMSLLKNPGMTSLEFTNAQTYHGSNYSSSKITPLNSLKGQSILVILYEKF